MNKKVYQDLKKDIQKSTDGKAKLIEVGPCTLHPVHTAVKKMCSNLDVEVDRILVSLHSLFKISLVRRANYKAVCDEVGEAMENFVHHVATRWGSILVGVNKVVLHFPSLDKFITQELPNVEKKIKDNIVYQNLLQFFEKKEENLVRFKFISYVVTISNKFNLRFQTESPSVCFIMDESIALFTRIANVICNGSSLPKCATDLFYLDIDEFLEENKKQELDIDPTLKALLNDLPEESKDDLEKEFFGAIIAELKHLQRNMNFDKPILEHLKAFDPKYRRDATTKANMLEVAKETGRFTEKEIENLDDEISVYTLELDDENIPSFNCFKDRLDIEFYPKIWKAIENKSGKIPSAFTKLTKLIMSLPHGQATIERSFR